MNTIGLFSGAGGLELGLEKAGLNIVVAQEYDRWAVATLQANRRCVVGGDILQLIKADKECSFLTRYADGEIFALAGGPPCQSFSFAGKRLGFDDERGILYRAYLAVVRAVNPRFTVMENVEGLVSKEGVLDQILRDFKRIGYTVTWGVLNAADFGAPQLRKRLIIISSRDNEKVSLPQPTHRDKHKTFGDAVEGLQDDGAGLEFSPKVKKLIQRVPEGKNWRSLSPRLQKLALGNIDTKKGGNTGVYRRLSFSKPSPTLMTSPMQKTTLLAHPKKDRPLSVREYARVQGFPDSWCFEGPVAKQYKQIGNAVPIALGAAIGRMLAAKG